MKAKRLLSLAVAASVAMSAPAVAERQEGRRTAAPSPRRAENELSFKAGVLPTIGFWTAMVPTLIYGIPRSLSYNPFFPALTVQYIRDTDSIFDHGGAATYNIPVMYWDGAVELHVLSLLYNLRITYRERGSLRTYAKLGVGLDLVLVTSAWPYVGPILAVSLVPFGVQFGGRKVFGTAELSFGSEGTLLTLGAGLRF